MPMLFKILIILYQRKGYIDVFRNIILNFWKTVTKDNVYTHDGNLTMDVHQQTHLHE